MKEATRIANRYEIINKLGQGGMGAVWRVDDRLEKHHVALKQVLISPKQLEFGSKARTDDTDKLRLSLAQEFSILATLRHPHILSVLDFGFDGDGHPFYTMTLLEDGQDVKSYATNISTGKRIKLLGQMLQALHYLHRRGILHRDLKPDNIFVTKDEQIKVMDFGLAKLDKGQSTESNTITGTINYMSPELFQGKSASVASDLFAVGVMVYEIMVGQHPFNAQTIAERIMKILTYFPDFSPFPVDFAPWLATILEKDPTERFATAYEAMIKFYDAVGVDMPAQSTHVRESYLQSAPFIGREAELTQLKIALNQARVGTSQFMLIGGESGVGKTRLIQELRNQALVDGFIVLRGQGVNDGGLPYQLWRDAIRRLLLNVTINDLQLGVLKDIVPDMDDLLGREIMPAPQLDGQAYRERLALAIVDVFKRAAQPILLILDDLQWVSESLFPLKQMLKVSEQLPQLLVIGTYRDDERPDLPDELTDMDHIQLTRLDGASIADLCQFMLGERVLGSDLIAQVEKESEGNTFIMVEMMRAIANQTNHLQTVDLDNIPQGILTQGMKHLFDQRLAQMPGTYLLLLQTAAVSGRQIDQILLQHLYPDVDISNWLYRAESLVILKTQDNRWQFIHDKLRETILAALDADTRRALHRTVAEAIEAIYPENQAYNESLMNHWHIAGDFDKELVYLDFVVQQMIELHGKHEAARNLIQHTLARMAADDGRQVSLLNWLAESSLIQSNYDESRRYAEAVRQLATQLDKQVELARSLTNLGLVAEAEGQYAASTDLYQKSLAIYQTLGNQRGIAINLNNLGRIADMRGDFARATRLLKESLALYQQLGDQRGIAINLNNLGIIAMSQGELARARGYYQQSLAISKQLGDQHGIAKTLNNLGVIAIDQGAYERASDLLRQSTAIKRQLGDRLGISMSLSNLGMIAENQGVYERALDLYQQALALSQQIGDQLGVCYGFVYLGGVAFKQKNGQATQWFAQALQMAQSIQATPEILWIVVGFVGVLAQDGQAERAARYAGLAEYHPAQENNTRKVLTEVMPLLEAALSPDELVQALEQGKALDLNTVVAELLAEFGDDEQNDSRQNWSDT